MYSYSGIGSIKAPQGKHFSIAYFSKQMIDSWNWILGAFECCVQWPAIYAESYSILSRRLVYNGGSTHPFSRLSSFFQNALFLEVLYFSYKIVLYRKENLSRSCFVWSNILFCVEMEFAFELYYSVIKYIGIVTQDGFHGE